ncbi:MAG: sensor domain-containing diguanylate cyclase [Actinomycetota bacterium]|nr:sensor domain-containing diguanylate cyclase [Actinomycetota bacterium]
MLRSKRLMLLLIGPGLDSFREPLESRGYKIGSFTSFEKAISEVPNCSAIIIDGIDYASLKKLQSASKGKPKIHVSFSGRPRRSVLGEPLAYHLQNPSPEELAAVIKRSIKDTGTVAQIATLKERNTGLESDLRFLDDLNKVLNSAADQSAVLSFLIKKFMERTGAENCAMYLLNTETGELCMEDKAGPAWTAAARVNMPVKGESVQAEVVRTLKPMLINSSDSRMGHKLERGIRHMTKSYICLPMKSRGKGLGAIELINKKGGEFTRKDLADILRFTDYISLAVERAVLYEKMQELVITDDLTKLFNTRYMIRSIETEVLRSKRYGNSVSLIFMDIDYFKEVNDNYGHLIGSKLLVEMGQFMLKNLRELDVVARYGGDEFVIILPQTNPQKAVQTAERLRRSLEQHVFLKKEGYNLKVTASFGVASYPESAGSREELIRLADEAMYKVKHRTRNGVYAIAEPAPNHTVE